MPYDAEVEWIETDGYSWIVTPYIEDVDCTISFKCRRSTWRTYGALFGNYISETHNSTRIIFSGSDDGHSYVNFVSRPSNTYYAPFTLKNNDFVVVMDKNGITVGQTFYAYNRSVGTSNSTYLTLFARDSTGTRCNAGDRLYNFSISKNNDFVFDFIPVRIGTTGYMYDRVSKKLFGNVGSGTFVLGEDKPQIAGYEVLHDISNWDNGNGASINTLLVPSDTNWSFEGSWMRIGTPTQAYSAIISAYDSEAANSYRIILANNDASRAYVNACTRASSPNTIAGLYQSIWYEYTLRYGSIIVNGSTTSLGTTQGTDLSANMYIASQGYPQRVGRFKAYHNNTLVADMIPCKRLSDNVCGMYDIVREQFFTSSNQYNFTE